MYLSQSLKRMYRVNTPAWGARTQKWIRISLLLSFTLLVTACGKEVLYTEIEEHDINMMIMILEKNGISAKRQKENEKGYSLLVDRSDFTRSVRVLKAVGFPRKKYQDIGKIFPGEGIVKSPHTEHVRFIYAQNQELEKTLSEIDGVVKARVHITVPERPRFGQASEKPTAAVAIFHNPGEPLFELVPKIKQIVAHGVSGMTYDNVAVEMLEIGRSNKVKSDGYYQRKNPDIRAARQFSPVESIQKLKPSHQPSSRAQRFKAPNLSFQAVLGLMMFFAGGVVAAIALLLSSRKE